MRLVTLLVFVALSFQIVLSACPNDCNGRGVCVSGNCQCDDGFELPDCGTCKYCSNSVIITTILLFLIIILILFLPLKFFSLLLVSYGECTVNPEDTYIDSDGDGISDYFDNCVDIPNPQQEDFDGDNVGDVCDNCPMKYVQQ
jgi:hypothetical protein